MTQPLTEYEQLRVSLDRLRSLLDGLLVRGLRACGADELAQLASYRDDLDGAGAGHVASILAELHEQIDKADRAAPRTLLVAQTSVRLLERLLTLRVARSAYAVALDLGKGNAMIDGADENDAEP